MREVQPLTRKTVFSWVYDMTQRQFLFLRSEVGSEVRPELSPESFEDLTSLGRINPKTGRVFSIMGAPTQPGDQKHILHTRGMVLSENPFVLSGISEEVTPEETGYYFDPGADEVVNILSDNNSNTARNVVHALKAPINRIKGIASILSEELEGEQHLELISFLRESNDRLASLANYLLEIRKDSDPQKPISAFELMERVGGVLKGWLPEFPRVQGQGEDLFIEPHLIQPLERLLVNLLTHEPQGAAGLKEIKVYANEGGTISLEVAHAIESPSKAISSEPFDKEDIPAGSVELIRTNSNALVFRALDNEQLMHRIVVPVVS